MKTKTKIPAPRNSANCRYHKPYNGQTFLKSSETLQDEAIGIRELMTRQQAGIPMRGHLLSTGTFNDESTGTDLRKLDFQELFEMKNDLKAKLAKKKALEEQTRIDQEKARLLTEVEEYHLQRQANKGGEILA